MERHYWKCFAMSLCKVNGLALVLLKYLFAIFNLPILLLDVFLLALFLLDHWHSMPQIKWGFFWFRIIYSVYSFKSGLTGLKSIDTFMVCIYMYIHAYMYLQNVFQRGTFERARLLARLKRFKRDNSVNWGPPRKENTGFIMPLMQVGIIYI